MDARWLLALFVAGFLLVACGGDADSDEDAALAVIENAYELWNSGDAVAWVEVRERGSFWESDEQRTEVLSEVLGWVEDRMTVYDVRYTEIDCESQGFGEWPGVADPGLPVAEGYYFICETEVTSANPEFEVTEVFNWVVAEGEVIAVNSEEF